jgi:hemolysin-activating ACP:hemolysin acyltransferase
VAEVLAPFGGAEEMVKDLKAKVFPGREIRFQILTRDGKKEVRMV